MATQSHRSNGPRGPTTAGPPESSPRRGLPRSLPRRRNRSASGARASMVSGGTHRSRGGVRWLRVLPLGLVLSLLAVAPALALDCVAGAGGIIDGFVNYPNPPAQINIDGNCTIRNYPASNPLTSNISWYG